MTLIRLLSAATLATACTLAAAQGPAAPASPAAPATPSSPAKKELVQKVLQLQQGAVESIARGLGEQSMAQIAQQTMAVLQARIPPEQREAVAKDIQVDFKKYGDEVMPLLRERALKLAPTTVGTMMEEKFTEDELKQVLAMLDSPIYRKYQSLGGDMQKVLLEKLITDTRPTVEPKLRALQEVIGKKLGMTNNGAAPKAAPAAKPPASAARK
ncbi:hypothetical protein [Ideonella sp. A 288]|uniref:hypothetical protein n=1 Tax=Ideonella sp. A 288 TaxID=1962181 RepID=UPI000B4B1055|nr:hypothetical protein [Ideonella sp. A 288]